MTNNQVLISYYNDLSKIYEKHSKKLIKELQSKYTYYDYSTDKIKPIFEKEGKDDIKWEKFSYINRTRKRKRSKRKRVLKYDDDNDNKPRIIQFKDGNISLFIPYSQLMPLRSKKKPTVDV